MNLVAINGSQEQIMNSTDPRQIQKLGRQVKNFEQAKWNENSQEFLYQANLYKFGQNEKFKNFIMSVPKNAIFVEASPLDKNWGIKMTADNPKAQNPFEWEGTNFLGFQITRARDYIISH